MSKGTHPSLTFQATPQRVVFFFIYLFLPRDVELLKFGEELLVV